jgi:hypothetical protein
MRRTTILQRILIVSSIIWLLWVIEKSHSIHRGWDIGRFAWQGFMPIVFCWGLYWIIIGIIKKWKNK